MRKQRQFICVDLAGIIYPYYEEIFQIVEEKKALFKPNCERQKKLGRILVMADAAHAFGAERDDKKCGQIADFTSFSFHAVKKSDNSRRRGCDLVRCSEKGWN